MSTFVPFSADGHRVRWATWDGTGEETTTLRWENEAWTISGVVSRERIEYVLRVSASWQVRQFLLFRDMEEPDLWLATDGGGRWGEVNGAHRTELDGCYDVDLACTPFTNTLPLRRLHLEDGDTVELPVVYVDPDTLSVTRVVQRYTRLHQRRWRYDSVASGFTVDFDVDEHGLVVDYPGEYRRITA